MPDDKQKILRIMQDIERDYEDGNLSPERYRYFKSKYQERLDNLNKSAATNRIRSMQGKPGPKRNRKKKSRRHKDNRKEKNDLVQKYIVNPKKGDKEFNKKKKKSMDSGTYALLVVLALVVAFTIGIGVGIFALDFEDMSVVNADALVTDTAFPDTSNATLEVATVNNNVTYEETPVENTYDDYYYDSSSDYGGGQSSTGGGSYEGGGSSESGGSSEGSYSEGV